MSKRIVSATFADGTCRTRTSVTKAYTHAYRATVKRPNGEVWSRIGFSYSEYQCRKNADAETAYARNSGHIITIEVVPVTIEQERAA